MLDVVIFYCELKNKKTWFRKTTPGLFEANKQQNFNTGPVVDDKLAPVTYGRIKTLFGHTWREEQLSTNFDWNSDSFSVYLPESLYVVSSIYLKINLPAIGSSGVYKPFPGIYCLKNIRLMSNGTELYTAEVISASPRLRLIARIGVGLEVAVEA